MASASETATVSAHGPCTPYNREPVDSVTVFKATYVWAVTVCVAVTGHLHFWQNDRDLLQQLR